MTPEGQFTEIGKTEDRMYGPRGLLVCGYTEEERLDLLCLIEKAGMADIRVVFASNLDLGTSVGEVLVKDDKPGFVEASDMPRAIVMSGLTQNELHGLIDAYKRAGFEWQIWASMTPVSEKWPLKLLLKELQAEDKAMKDKRKK